jgi:hypothetical protein
VDVLPKRTQVTVAPWRVTASVPTNSATPTNVPTSAELKSYLDTVYGKQANVFITVLSVIDVVTNYDLNTNGVLDISLDDIILSSEQAAITNAAYVSGAFNIYYVNAMTNFAGFAYKGYNAAFIQDSHENSSVNITAHEMGHLFGIRYDVGFPPKVSGDPDRLMWGDPPLQPNPCRLIRSEWQRVNKTAGGQQ